MALHHATLKAAVKKYQPLHAEGKTEEEIKTALKADEKEYDEESVNEIYNSIINPAPEKDEKEVYTVVNEFRDIDDFSKVHAPGSDVSHFKKERLDGLVKAGHVKKEE